MKKSQTSDFFSWMERLERLPERFSVDADEAAILLWFGVCGGESAESSESERWEQRRRKMWIGINSPGE